MPYYDKTRTAALTVLLLCSAALLHASDWPFWRGPDSTGASDEVGLIDAWSVAGENLLWRVDFVGRSTPVVFDGRVCVTGRGGTGIDRHEVAACYAPDSGKQLWERRFDVYLTTVPFNRVGWASPVGDPETGYLYVQGVGGLLTCLDRAGKTVWGYSLAEQFGRLSGYGGRTAAPILFEDLLIVGVINVSWGKLGAPRHRYYAFDKRSGAVVWIATPGVAFEDANTQSEPIVITVDGRALLVAGNGDGKVYALAARTGEKVWEYNLSKRGLNSSVVSDGRRIYAGHSEENIDEPTMGRLVAIDPDGSGDVTRSKELWRVNELAVGYSSPTYHDGRLYVVDNAANLRCLDTRDGTEFWRADIGTVGKGSPVWADGKIYVTEVNGRISVLDAASGKMLDQEQLNNPDGRYAETYGSPAISGGRIYFTTEEGLYCLGRKGPGAAAARHTPASHPRAAAGATPAALLAVPGEVLIAPGDTVQLEARAFDAKGLPIGPVVASWTLDGVAGTISAEGKLVADPARPFQVGEVVATANGLSARARIRVIAKLPWKEDFETFAADAKVSYWLASGRFPVAEREGGKQLSKPPVPSGLHRSISYLGTPSLTDYTIEVDLQGSRDGRTMSDMGLVNSGYLAELKGGRQELEVSSWQAVLRMARKIPFSWEPDTWYRMKLRVDRSAGKGVVRVKVWPRDAVEPADWSLEVEDPHPVSSGSPGIYGNSPAVIHYDNLVVEPNPPLKGAPAAPVVAATASGNAVMFGHTPSRNMVSPEKGLPSSWDVETGENIKWVAQLGSQTYAGPILANGKVFVGTNNEGLRDPEQKDDRGVVMAFDAESGAFLWQITHEKLPTGRVNDWPLQGVCSTPAIEGERAYYVSNQAQVVAVDTEGFLDQENDGPFTGEKYTGKKDGDIIWSYDMIGELDVFPHNLAVASPLLVGDLLFIITGNGVDEGHVNIPSPQAPSFIAVDKNTGKLVWESSEPGDHILHGSWANAAYGTPGGRPQVIFPGGNGWVYSFAPTTGQLLWKFDCNPKESVWELGGSGTRNNIIASPVVHGDHVYIGVGQDPEHGEGIGNLWAIDATGNGDVTGKHAWHLGGEDYNRTISTVAIDGDLLYAADLSGYLYCLELATGKVLWKHNTFAAVWSSPYVADGKVYMTDEDGDVAVLEAGRKEKLLHEMNMGNAVYTTPLAKNGVLYIASRSKLFAIAEKGK